MALKLDKLADKVAVITGAGSGIGRALAQACAAEGMRLMLVDLKMSALEETQHFCGGATKTLLRECDVSEEDAVERVACAVYAHYGAAHLLFNNAGVFTGGPLWRARNCCRGCWRSPSD